MIAADTSTWVAFLEGGAGEDAQLLDKALEDRPIPASPQYGAFSPRHHFRVMESCSTLLSTEVLCHTVLRETPFRLRLRHHPSRGLQFLFDIQRELNHALRHLFGRLTSKVLKHQLLNIEPHKITQQERATARGENKIAMPVIHDDQVALSIESRAPQFPANSFKGVAR